MEMHGGPGYVIKHAAAIVAAATLIIACMFYPYLPGQYDALAVTLSAMAQIFAIVGLLLVPIGALWLILELRSGRRAAAREKRFEYGFGLAALGAATLVVIATALGAAVDAHPSFGLFFVALWAVCVIRLFVWLRRRREARAGTFNPLPLYLLVLPLVAAGFRFAFIAPAVEFSRKRAMENCATLIDEIERYQRSRGRYPLSLQSLNDDYRPGMVGVARYHYEPNGESYNVYFRHFGTALDVWEIVMFNPRGEHEFTSHNADLLQYSDEQLSRARGYFSVRDASQPNWKYFLFD